MICQQQTVMEDAPVTKVALPAVGLLSFSYSAADAAEMVSPVVWVAIAAVSSGSCCSFPAVAVMEHSVADSDVAAKIATSYNPKRSCQTTAPLSFFCSFNSLCNVSS